MVKHADARHVSVSLTRTRDKVQLSIVDDGKGFDLGRARGTGGLGLGSIDERARRVIAFVISLLDVNALGTRSPRCGATQCTRALLGFDERNRFGFGQCPVPVRPVCSRE